MLLPGSSTTFYKASVRQWLESRAISPLSGSLSTPRSLSLGLSENRATVVVMTTIILTPEQHAELRRRLEDLMDYATFQRDVAPQPHGAHHEAAMNAAEALDMLDDAVATLAMCALPDDTVWH